MEKPNAIGSIRDVVDGSYCVGCGGCAAVSGSPVTMGFDWARRLQAQLPETGDLPEVLDKVCPFTGGGDNEDAITEPLYSADCQHDDAVGWYRGVFVGSVAEPGFRERGTSGGVGSWVASRLLESGMIDGVIHVQPNPGEDQLFRYSVSRSSQQLAQGSSSRYYPVEMSGALKEVAANPGRYLFVGLPCFVKAFRKLVAEDATYGASKFLTMGIVCGHLKSTRFADMLAWEVGIAPGRLKNIDFRVKLQNQAASNYGCRVTDGEKSVVMRKRGSWVGNWGLGFFKYGACEFCDDVFAETADIVIGDAWIREIEADPRGNSLIVTRDKTVHALIEQGATDGGLDVAKITVADAVRSQVSGVRYRRDGLKYRMYLKDQKGEWHPPKRVEAGKDHLDPVTQRRFEIRAEVARLSHGAFREAEKRGSYRVFRRSLNPLVREHQRLTEPGRRYLSARIRDWFRPFYFWIKPPKPLYPERDLSDSL